uniref:Acetyltransferase n=1 Tax=uncultured bacterium pFosLip TaxID=380391 RepID=Q1PAF4_9BACT|nr:acetyltransferase [uncultured bacterium pFosLip]
MNLEIREMTIDDLAPVFHLGEELFTSESLSNLYRTWDEFEVTAFYQSTPEYCLVADDDGKLAGFLLGTTIEKAGTAWNYGHLVWLGIHTEYQRHGIGNRLFEAYRQLMIKEGIRIIFVDTQADNEAAVKFFEDLGFARGTEHVYMSLNLDTDIKT